MPVAVFAPAKLNLYLHVVGRRADGYHLLDSLVAFADFGDRLEARPAADLSLAVEGAEAKALAGLGEDNLVLVAARRLAEHAGVPARAALRLEKRLPVASGLGGGSSDAAAALRALFRLWRLSIGEEELARLGASIGADLPVCLYGRPAWVGGIGERLEPAEDLPPAGILVANPRIELPTAAVFSARKGPFRESGRFKPMPKDAAGLAQTLRQCGNDLTEAAIGLVPEVARLIERLAALPGALLARMSGSGASAFALFSDRTAAEAAGAALAEAEPGWWGAAGRLVAGKPLSR